MNQIIEKNLHNSDEEVKIYTTNLVDQLEQVRFPPLPRLLRYREPRVTLLTTVVAVV